MNYHLQSRLLKEYRQRVTKLEEAMRLDHKLIELVYSTLDYPTLTKYLTDIELHRARYRSLMK